MPQQTEPRSHVDMTVAVKERLREYKYESRSMSFGEAITKLLDEVDAPEVNVDTE